MLAMRDKAWAKLRQGCTDRMEELADVFGGKQKLSRIQPNKRLEKWLLDRAAQIKTLSLENASESSRLAVSLITALEDAREFHQLEANLQVTQYISETKDSLLTMIRLAGAEDDILVQLQILSDFSYGWHIVDNFTGLMQSQIKEEPQRVAELRSLFLKLSGAMEGAMVRLGEAGSRDLYPVSQHYSRRLVAYIRKVLQVIPAAMFRLLEEVIRNQRELLELPTRLEKDKLKEYSQLDRRWEIARLTHKVSILSRGILALKTTLVGVVQVDPKKLLEEGIRRELVSRVASILHSTFIFNPKSKDRVGDLCSKIKLISKEMEGFRKSFEYIEDYINIPGLRLWQEEISRIINHAVEKEAAGFLKNAGDSYNQYQSLAVPIPEFPPVQGDISRTFIGRLVREMLLVTDAGASVYVDSIGAWFSPRAPHSEILGPGFIQQLGSALGVPGMAGVSRLLGLMTITEMQNIQRFLSSELSLATDTSKQLEMTTVSLKQPEEDIVTSPVKTYASCSAKIVKQIQTLHTSLSLIGQFTQLRRSICCHLTSISKFDSKLLHSCLQSFQQSILNSCQQTDSKFPKSGVESELMTELIPFLQWSGLDDPLCQVYSPSSRPPERMASLLALSVLHNLARMVFSTSTGFLISKRPAEVDGWVFLTGLSILLIQFNEQIFDNMDRLLEQAENSFTLGNESLELNNLSIFRKFLRQSLKSK